MTDTARERLPLRDRRVLVVEDEYIIASEIAEELSNAGAHTLGPVPQVSDAVRLILSEDRIDGALMDVNLRNEPVWPAVDLLLQRGVLVVLATGYDAAAIPPDYADLPRYSKPTSGQDLARALARMLG